MEWIECFPGSSGPTKEDIVKWIRKNISYAASVEAKKTRNKTSLCKLLQKWQEEEQVRTLAHWSVYTSSKVKKSNGESKEEKKEIREEKKIDWNAVTHVLGPIRITEMVGLGKHIYLMGESHEWLPTCPKPPTFTPTIAQLLEYMIRSNPNKQIDLFIETAFLTPQRPTTAVRSKVDPGLWELTNLFNRCLSRSKALCEFPNLRAHYIDVRDISGIDTALLDQLFEMDDWLGPSTIAALKSAQEAETEFKAESDFVSATNDLLDEIASSAYKKGHKRGSLSHETLADQLVIDPSTYRRINKQLNQIESHFVIGEGKDRIRGDAIADIIRRNAVVGPSKDELMDAIAAVEWIHYAVGTRKRYVYIPTKYVVPLFAFSKLADHLAGLLDQYTLGRLFRSFSTPEHGRKPADPPKNVVIFAGDWHIANDEVILKQLGFKTIASATSDVESVDRQCLDIRGFPRPFFGSRPS